MITLPALLLIATGWQAPSIQALSWQPTDDLWVYSHAGDPEKDEFLRAWGSEGRAVPGANEDESAFSYSLLKWDLSGCPKGAKLTSAKLILTHVGEAGFSADSAKAAPLEARRVSAAFSEKGWSNGQALVRPGSAAEDLFGVSKIESVPSVEFKIEIDLLAGKGDFRKAFEEACQQSEPRFALALASSIDPQSVGMKGIYKVFSKDAKTPEFRPTLKLDFQP